MKKTALFTILTVALVVLSVVLGILAGYNRLGWNGLPSGLAGEHGALMVGSFLGTLIILERAVTAKNKWFLAFQLSVLGMLFSFPFQGYGAISIAFSTLHIVLSVVLAVFFIRDKNKIFKNSKPLSLGFALAGLFFCCFLPSALLL